MEQVFRGWMTNQQHQSSNDGLVIKVQLLYWFINH